MIYGNSTQGAAPTYPPPPPAWAISANGLQIGEGMYQGWLGLAKMIPCQPTTTLFKVIVEVGGQNAARKVGVHLQ